ncbi:MAG TPA: phosphate signaling complex protein PhoU [Anaerolineae bacterium]|nr:phosphate signaling complex protein PhoU [Anaerolineae bacterium]
MATVTHRTALDRDLRAVQDDMLRLGSLIDSAIDRALQALANRDFNLARQIIADDAQVNDLRFQIEEACFVAIATQQPAARDLRVLVAAMNIVSDLERMADHAAGIAEIVLRMGDEPLLKPLIDMPRMAAEARDMLRHALDAYVRQDAELARSVAVRDDVIDGLYKQIFRELLSFMLEDPRTTTRALYLLFSAHNLERIGDHITNIAERVIFMASGIMKELNV